MSTQSRTLLYYIIPGLKLTCSILALGVFFILNGCNEGKHHIEKAKFQVTSPWRQDLDLKKEYVAQIHAVQHIELRAFERGYLQSIFVDEGQLIKKGQKMFQIMPLLMKAEYEKAKAEYQVAKIEYRNTRSLARKQVVSANELALAKANLDKGKAELDLAKSHLDLTQISAPFDGIMDRFHVRLGSLVEDGELLTTLSDNSKMWVYFNVSESDYLDYMEQKKAKTATEVQLKLANGRVFDQVGKIDTIEADFNHDTGNVAFRASFPNPNGLLRHGETGSVILTEPLKAALVVPQKATFEILDKKFVYVIDQENKVQSRQIKISNEVEHLFVVESGLKEGEKILLEGLGKVRLNDEIESVYQEPGQVMKNLALPLN